MNQDRPLWHSVVNLDFDGPDNILPVGREVQEKEILHALLQCLLQNSARLLELATAPDLGKEVSLVHIPENHRSDRLFLPLRSL